MLQTVLGLAGDALWIIALSIMAGASRAAWPRIAPDAAVPMLTGKATGLRLPRAVALCVIPAVGFAVGLALLVLERRQALDLTYALMSFGLRSTLAALFALAHLRWLQGALETLDAEGQLRP